ncbi:MAG: hypothetical protein KKE83_02615 [Proteobacteria bacterium]|nr:hypothetical protein [Pseudomonadota bacterium]MBU1547809.1 hypothetical protein [Pseudomonadota bacterium]MBU2618558.1 hypothetical protein [Pseudomonadota bacterium]
MGKSGRVLAQPRCTGCRGAGRLLQQQYGLEQLLLEFLRQRGRLIGGAAG